MFGNFGWGEFLVLGLIAMFIFGPDRLPSLARDAAKGLRKVRETARDARERVRDELGPELGDFDPRDLNPRVFVRKHLFDDDPFYTAGSSGWAGTLPDHPALPERVRPVTRPLAEGEAAPFDLDAT